MALRFVIDGISVEADSASEAVALIKMLGKGSSAPKPAQVVPTVRVVVPSVPTTTKAGAPGSDWNSAAVQRLSMTLSKAGRELLKLLISQARPTSTREIVSALGMTDIRGTGALISGFRKTIAQLGLSDPLVITPRAQTEDKSTLVDLVPAFRLAAAGAGIA